jgi:Na+/H+ antiporter NhaD/arsenite permease-like protein
MSFGAFALLLTCPGALCAAENLAVAPPVVMVAPFALLLLAIAVLPLCAAHFWEKNLHKALVAFALAGPVVGYLFALDRHTDQHGLALLENSLLEYVEFIILLGSLYTVSGGIVLQGRLRPTPWVNAAFLLAGAVLANLIGTTGASMLLVRPLLRINHQRKNHAHLPIFFIFIVSNLGGLLTPLGDPPLFLGFLRGVDFFFTFSLWPHWLIANGAVLGVFFVWDLVAYWREPHDVQAEEHHSLFSIRGLVNLAFLLGIVVGVLLKSEEVGSFLRVLPAPWPEVLPSALMVLMALLSFLCTPAKLHQHNHFNWDAILEVAILFLGIFITMVPALVLLSQRGRDLGLTQAWHYFWASGSLSSFLDNAPTYLTFATAAAEGRGLDELMRREPLILQAISAGSVFMGANTYIGNGPNFMVKSIAEGMHYKMPSFFGYMAYSCAILLPIFALVTWLFF